jgi:tetratricopeptide (TPR) repeat protein
MLLTSGLVTACLAGTALGPEPSLAQAPSRAQTQSAPGAAQGQAAGVDAVLASAASPGSAAEQASATNVLVLSFDDLSFVLSAPTGTSAPSSAPLPVPGAGAAPELPVPVLPVPAAPVPPAAIQPASAEFGLGASPLVWWSAQAQKRAQRRAVPGAESSAPAKKGSKPPERDPFLMEPEPWLDVAPPGREVVPSAPGATTREPTRAPLFPGGSGAESGFSGASARVAREPGRAQAAAGPLRRALLRAGFKDVLTASPDSNVVERAVSTRRLSARTLEEVRAGVARLAAQSSLSTVPSLVRNEAGASEAPAVPVVQAPAIEASENERLFQAAARIGQILGYRAVVALGVAPQTRAAASTSGAAKAASTSTYVLAVVDAMREMGDVVAFDESGASEMAAHEAAGASAGAILSRTINSWPLVTPADRAARVAAYLSKARSARDGADWQGAEEALNQVLALEPGRADVRLMLAEVLQPQEPAAAALIYRNALRMDGGDGETWARAAVAFTIGPEPDWPRALEAGRKALALKFDSASLRQAMATAQLGRAELFHRANRTESAQEAEQEATLHLERARSLAPEDPSVLRLMMRQLVQQRRYRDVVRALDGLALQFPDDAELQGQYATALTELDGRDEDAFVAWARVWRLTGSASAPLEASRYRRLSEGFDRRLASLARQAAQVAAGVSAGTTNREAALLQMTRFKEDMGSAVSAIKIMQPPVGGALGMHSSRVFAADLVSQALEAFQVYFETGQELYRARGGELHRQGITMLNAARSASR